jgi:hypothetical protein
MTVKALPGSALEVIETKFFVQLLVSLLANPSRLMAAARVRKSVFARQTMCVCHSRRPRDPEAKAWLTAFQDGLQQLGWLQGRNISIDYRWADGDWDRLRPTRPSW